MAVPRNKLSKTRKRTRRAHDAKSPTQLSDCPNCSALKPSHVVCASCGYYAGKSVVAVQGAE